jgi:hypothetical protein
MPTGQTGLEPESCVSGDARRVLVNHVALRKTRLCGCFEEEGSWTPFASCTITPPALDQDGSPDLQAGWSFESSDIPGLTGGTDAYDAAHAEEAARFALACAAEEQGLPAPTDLTFDHFVPAGAAVAA